MDAGAAPGTQGPGLPRVRVRAVLHTSLVGAISIPGQLGFPILGAFFWGGFVVRITVDVGMLTPVLEGCRVCK